MFPSSGCVLLLTSLSIMGSEAIRCYSCKYDSSRPSSIVCKTQDETLSTTTCAGVCIVDHVINKDMPKEILSRSCMETAHCSGFESMRFVSYGYGTRRCCATDYCNVTGDVTASSVLVMSCLAMVQILSKYVYNF